MVRWVACLPEAEAARLAALRLLPGLEVASQAGVVWLRGPACDDALDFALRKVSGLRRFTVQADGQMIAEGARVPGGWLPALTWQPLRSSQPVALPVARGPGQVGSLAALGLVRSSVAQPAQALLTTIEVWLAWAGSAAEIRLRPLRFAAAHDGRVWIEGSPLPALPGQHFYLAEGVAIPCGLACEPDPGARVLRRWLSLAGGDTALAHPEGRWEILRAEQFVPAMRSAARRTAEVLGRA
jgi:hypothetical protein